jgi:hypothetical protein
MQDTKELAHQRVIFVGQSPSEDSDPNNPLMGRTGEKIADMLGVDLSNFAKFTRVNLNPCFSGKSGKGDAFDQVVGEMIAHTLLGCHFTRYVLLGSNVARCFALPWDGLVRYERGDKSFLLLPHPSGINQWYNSQANRSDAAKYIKRFVYEE